MQRSTYTNFLEFITLREPQIIQWIECEKRFWIRFIATRRRLRRVDISESTFDPRRLDDFEDVFLIIPFRENILLECGV